jgi:hypothetical protein
MPFLIVWGLCALIAYIIGASKGREAEGLLLGIVLPGLGILIVGAMQPRTRPATAGSTSGHDEAVPPKRDRF